MELDGARVCQEDLRGKNAEKLHVTGCGGMGVHEFAAGFREVKKTLRNRCYRGLMQKQKAES